MQTYSELILEKIKIMEGRRNYFGNIFWRMPGLTIAVLVLFLGLAARPDSELQWWFMLAAAVALGMLGFVANRLKAVQDEAEDTIASLETRLREQLAIELPDQAPPSATIELPRGARHGARFTIVLGFWLTGAVFLGLAVAMAIAAEPGP